MRYTFAITFDYLCPFARNANEHVTAALRDGADWQARFLPYSLAQGHVEEGDTAIWDRENPLAASGILALAAGIVVRDEQPDRFLDVHDALFAARHDHGRDIKDAEVVATALRDGGVDPDTVLPRVAGGEVLPQLRAEHEEARDIHGVWGVPTFVTPQRAVFVRLLDRPAGDGRAARHRIEHVVELVNDPAELHEFKQVDLPV